MEYSIGIDIGTSAVKTVLTDENGMLRMQESQIYPMEQPDNGWAEQDPEDWKKAVIATIRAVIKKSGVSGEQITCIGLTGQMHGLVMLDKAGKVLRKSIIWCDQRSWEQADWMLSLMPERQWMEITGNPPLAAWTAAKILWVREHEPEIYEKCCHILLPKDYIRYVLTGEFATDVSDGSGMQLLDVEKRQWSDYVLEKLELEKDFLGQVYESQEITGTVTSEMAEACGLAAGTKVVAGAADNAAAAVGMGVVSNGQAFTSIGTSALVYAHLDRCRHVPNGSLHLCCAAVPNSWFVMGGPQAAGLSLEWVKDNFCGEYKEQAQEKQKDIYELINEKTEEIPVGSERLIYLPFLMGERTPHMDPKYRGAFIGLNVIHTNAHLLRAVMEGVAYSLADCCDILSALEKRPVEMRICGGGGKSPVWRQILADLYECRIMTVSMQEGPAYGAAILAGVGVGHFKDVKEACDALIKVHPAEMPKQQETMIYRNYHSLYRRVYEHLKSDFNELYSF